MSAPDPRLGEIEARLSAATPGPWVIDSIESGEHGVFAEEHHRLGCGTSQVAGFMTKANAELLVNAPADVAYLLTELQKRDNALARVEALHRPSRREHARYNSDDTLISYTVTEDGPCVACYPETRPTHCEDCDDESCTGNSSNWNRQPWPCPTRAAVTAAKGEARNLGTVHKVELDVRPDNWLDEKKNASERRQGVIDATNGLLRSLNLDEIREP